MRSADDNTRQPGAAQARPTGAHAVLADPLAEAENLYLMSEDVCRLRAEVARILAGRYGEALRKLGTQMAMLEVALQDIEASGETSPKDVARLARAVQQIAEAVVSLSDAFGRVLPGRPGSMSGGGLPGA